MKLPQGLHNQPRVAELLSIRSAHSWLHKITPSLFYHPGPLNTRTDHSSRRFDLSTHPFL